MLKISKLLAPLFTLLISLSANTVHAGTLLQDSTKAAILTYHRIGEDTYPETNLRLEQFEEHITEITQGDYTVLPLRDILSAIENNRPLPPRTIAITFEGAYKSALTNAFPILHSNNLPFTVFYASEKANQDQTQHLNWKELKALHKRKNVSLGTLPAIYDHTSHKSEQDILAALNKARQHYRENFGEEAQYLAYPFGEYSAPLKQLAATQGFTAAFTLNSGVIHSASDIMAIPRFSLTEDYGDLERFRMITNALPLPITEQQPTDPMLNSAALNIGFTLPAQLEQQADTLSCFLSGYGRIETEKLGTRIEIRHADSAHDTRLRLNCTLPQQDKETGQTQWRWLGLLFHRNINQEPHALPTPQE